MSAGIEELVNAVRSGTIPDFGDARFSNFVSLGAYRGQASIRMRLPSGYEVLVPVAQEALSA